MSLRIVKKVDDKCTIPMNAAYAWEAQWKIDDHKNIPRKVRGSYRDKRIKDECK